MKKEQFSLEFEFFSPVTKNSIRASFNLEFYFRKEYFAFDVDIMGLNMWFVYRSKKELARHIRRMKALEKEFKHLMK